MTAVMSPACLEVLQKNNQRGCIFHTDPPNLLELTNISQISLSPSKGDIVLEKAGSSLFLWENKQVSGEGQESRAIARELGAARGAPTPAQGWGGQVAPAGGSSSAVAQIEQNRATTTTKNTERGCFFESQVATSASRGGGGMDTSCCFVHLKQLISIRLSPPSSLLTKLKIKSSKRR